MVEINENDWIGSGGRGCFGVTHAADSNQLKRPLSINPATGECRFATDKEIEVYQEEKKKTEIVFSSFEEFKQLTDKKMLESSQFPAGLIFSESKSAP